MSYFIGGTVSGLATGAKLSLLNKGTDALSVNADGNFTFPTPIAYGASYSVTVGTQPSGQTCSLANGSGAAASVTANVSDVAIVCSTNTFGIGGTVSGLASGTQLTLLDNDSDALTVTADGPFTFPTALAYNASYAVTVGTQPSGRTCSLANAGFAAGVTANVTDVSVVCSTTTFGIGGTVSGLASGTQLTLLDNGSDALTVTADGPFTFPTALAYNASYAVTVGTQPSGRTCSLANAGSGAGLTANVTNVSIVCSTSTFSIGGTVSGLIPGTQVTLLNNGSDALTITADGPFTFATRVAFNGSYAATISTQPSGQTCSFTSAGSAVGVTSNVTDAALVCIARKARITTVAGTGAFASMDGAGSSASFNNPWGVAVDAGGNVFVGDVVNSEIRKITPTGDVTTLAGTTTPGSADGAGALASFYRPSGLAVDGNGNVYVADAFNHEIRKISSTGTVSTLAGSTTPGAADGTGAAASFNAPTGVAVDVQGNVYVADSGNHEIRKIAPNGAVTTLAGSPTPGASDGAGAAASFNYPRGVAVDRDGTVYVADANNNEIRRVTSSGIVTTLAGSTTPGSSDGVGATASFHAPNGVALDTAGNIYVADQSNNMIRKVTLGGLVSTLAGTGAFGSTDGVASSATFSRPRAVAVDASGNVYVADTGNNKIRKIAP